MVTTKMMAMIMIVIKKIKWDGLMTVFTMVFASKASNGYVATLRGGQSHLTEQIRKKHVFNGLKLE